MKKIHSFILLFLISAYFSGCTYNISRNDSLSSADFYSSLTEGCRERQVVVITRDSVFKAGELEAGKDSLKGTIFQRKYWDEVLPSKHFSISNNEIKKISVTKRTTSILKGMLYGSLTAAVVSGVYHNAHPAYQDSFQDEQIAVMMMVPGALIGAILGGITGDDYIFSYGEKPELSELLSGNAACRFGIKYGKTRGYMAEYTGIGPSGIHFTDEPSPGYHFSFFYNLPLTMNLSLNNELSLISSGYRENYTFAYLLPGEISSNNVSSVFTDRTVVLEAAPLARLNLMKKNFTPYIFLGPQIDILLKGHSSRNSYYELVNHKLGNNGYSLSGEDKSFWIGLTAGAGISTGKLLPVELQLEIRYKEDLTKIYLFHNNFPSLFDHTLYDFYQTNSDLMFSIGVALDRL